MNTAALSGMVFLILLVGATLTVPLSFFLLWLYRRAVLRGMNVAAGMQDAAPPPPAATPPPSHSLRITKISPGSQPITTGDRNSLDRAVTLSLRRVTLAYIAAGLVFAAVFAGAWSAQTGGGFLPIRFFVLTVDFSWPIVLAVSQLAALGWRDRLRFAVLYLVVFGVATVLGLLISSVLDPLGLIGLWLTSNGLGTLLLLAFLTRRIRSVGPLVLAFMIAGVTGANLLALAIQGSSATTRGLVRIFGAAGMGAVEVLVFILLAGFVILGVVGWWLLRLVGQRYRQKRMSDQALTLDAMWLLFAVTNSIILAPYDWRWLISGPLAFGVYKLILWAAFAWFVKPANTGWQPPILLLLRVFSLGSRSLRLFDALARRWLRAGPMVLIAGPDLVTGIVEPPEFLDFVGGRVSRRFVQGKDDLEQRLTQLDAGPDPDGRYRVNEFFCRSDTWQMTMRQLAARSDHVLMDLRSFSATNQGCRYELGQLLGAVPLTVS